jgi:hypothetical protein
MSNSASLDRGDRHRSPITGMFATEIRLPASGANAGDVAGRRPPAIISECSSASRRYASLRPRAAGLTVLTPIPRSPFGRLRATGRVFVDQRKRRTQCLFAR